MNTASLPLCYSLLTQGSGLGGCCLVGCYTRCLDLRGTVGAVRLTAPVINGERVTHFDHFLSVYTKCIGSTLRVVTLC